MKRWTLVLAGALALTAGGAFACPACKDQVPTQKTADGRKLVDPMDTQRGFALSIYVLLSAVYGLPCMLGFAIWRSVKGAEANKRRRLALAASAPRAAVPVAHQDELGSGLPVITWGPAREEAGS